MGFTRKGLDKFGLHEAAHRPLSEFGVEGLKDPTPRGGFTKREEPVQQVIGQKPMTIGEKMRAGRCENASMNGTGVGITPQCSENMATHEVEVVYNPVERTKMKLCEPCLSALKKSMRQDKARRALEKGARLTSRRL